MEGYENRVVNGGWKVFLFDIKVYGLCCSCHIRVCVRQGLNVVINVMKGVAYYIYQKHQIQNDEVISYNTV